MNNEKKKTLKIETKVKDKKRFNTPEALGEYLDETKVSIVLNKAQNKLLIGAKDSGKTIVVVVDEIYRMETDPMMNALGARKYSTGASKRLASAILKNTIRLKQKGFHFEHEYHKTQQYIYRQKDKRNNYKNQAIEFVSFEDEDGLAGVDVNNGGYIGLVHIEEPALKGDDNPTGPEEWDSIMQTLKDSANRTVRDYAATDPYHAPFNPTWWYTLNDWDEGHYLSQLAEEKMPRQEFLDWVLGFSSKVLLGNKRLVDENWEEIKHNLTNNHTKQLEIPDIDGESWLIVRMTKFANPNIREPRTDLDKESYEKAMRDAYDALWQADTTKLARVLGMLYEGVDTDPKVHNFFELDEEFKADGFVREEGRKVLGFSIGVDIDVDRRLTLTPSMISAVKYNAGNPFQPNYKWRDHKISIHPHRIINAYGKGENGKNTRIYKAGLLQTIPKIIEDYKDVLEGIPIQVVVDDNGGTWADALTVLKDSGIVDNLQTADKNGAIHGIPARQDRWQVGLEGEHIMIDEHNKEMFEFLYGVKKDKKGTRIEKGKYEKLADFINSAEYSLIPFVGALKAMIKKN